MTKAKKEKTINVLRIIYIALIIIVLYFPIAIIVLQSFNMNAKLGDSWGGFTFKWYKGIVENKSLLSAIKNSIMVAILTTIISSIAGTFIAIGIHNMNKKVKKYVMLLNNVPILNADIVTGISVMIICLVLSSFLPIELLGFPAMLIAHVFFTLPYVVLSVLPKLSELDENLYEAAVDLGCRPYKALLKIVIPAIKAGIISGAMLAFTLSIDDFVISYYTTKAGFDNFSTWLYPKIGKRNFSPSSYAYNALLTMIIVIVVLGSQFIKIKKRRNK